MPKVDKDYSLYRTYVIFRTLGLRHLVVVNVHNHVVGIITRKDLMPFMMQERLEALLQQATGDDVPLALQRKSTDSVEPPPVYFIRRRPTDEKSVDSLSIPSVGRKLSANNRKILVGVEETDEETDGLTSPLAAETEPARDTPRLKDSQAKGPSLKDTQVRGSGVKDSEIRDPHLKNSEVRDPRLKDSAAGVQIFVSAPPQKNDKQDWV